MINSLAGFFTKFKAESGAVLDLKDASGGFFLRTATKTADYTCVKSDSGTIFDTRGASGAVIFTLPGLCKGWWAIFVNGSNNDVTITNATADALITFNDTAADGVALSTTSEKTGGMVLVVCDGTAYMANKIGGNTLTVNT